MSNQEPLISESETKLILFLARRTIEAELRNDTPPEPKEAELHPLLKAKRACFVSLHIHDTLRGCIGSLEANEALCQNIIKNAYNAAFRDPRFPPLTEEESAIAKIEVSVLTLPREIESSTDFVAGRHGIILEKGSKRSVFLPQVATQQKWDRETTLNNLARKAGLEEAAWRRPEARLQVFEAIVCSE